MRKLLNLDAVGSLTRVVSLARQIVFNVSFQDAPTPFYPFAGQEISSKSQVTTVTKGKHTIWQSSGFRSSPNFNPTCPTGDRHVNVSSTLLPSGEEVVTSSESGSTATVTTVTATNKGNTDLLDLATKTTPTAKEQASTKTPEAKTDDVLEGGQSVGTFLIYFSKIFIFTFQSPKLKSPKSRVWKISFEVVYLAWDAQRSTPLLLSAWNKKNGIVGH